MKIRGLTFLFLLALSNNIEAQESSVHKVAEIKEHSFYFELGGIGGIYSLNYERAFTQKISARAGISYTPAAFENLATLPLSVSYLTGGTKHFFEVGAGVTMFYAGSDDLLELDFSSGNTNSSEEIFGVGLGAILGYRFHPETDGLLFRATVQPVYIPRSDVFGIIPGLSIGYSF